VSLVNGVNSCLKFSFLCNLYGGMGYLGLNRTLFNILIYMYHSYLNCVYQNLFHKNSLYLHSQTKYCNNYIFQMAPLSPEEDLLVSCPPWFIDSFSWDVFYMFLSITPTSTMNITDTSSFSHSPSTSSHYGLHSPLVSTCPYVYSSPGFNMDRTTRPRCLPRKLKSHQNLLSPRQN
jgi:hypothetical protein